jgi:hypothetical protein
MDDSINYKEIEKIINASTPGPWGPYTTNLPFYAIVEKPAPSASKHDGERPTYWRVEDAQFVVMAREVLPKLVVENTRLREALEYILEMSDYINTRDTIQKAANNALKNT